MQDLLWSAHEQGLVSALILTDLSAAFDTVNHKLLLRRLHTFGMSIYNTFLVMLNKLNPNDLTKEFDFMVIITHIMFVFMVPIMLLNFLIGLMSTETNMAIKTQTVGLQLGRVSVATLIESRFKRLFKFYYKRQHERLFCVEGDNIYVKCLMELWNVIVYIDALMY